ncbi:MAG TPA: glycoside hydrolase family 104 protein, partial [Rhodanobacteraceae bacterium]|nr:glycoside hydrolase family 104 protein [Rhodanobacteraceae bacterium]
MCRISANAARGKNVCAFLDMLAWSEIGPALLAKSDDGYNVNVGGELFVGYAQHPRTAVRTRWGWSDAAGRYQIMAAIPGRIETDTWDWASKAAGVADFTPASQDQVCIYLIKHHGALDDVIAGRFAEALVKCSKEWASLPGAGYGQHEQRFTG